MKHITTLLVIAAATVAISMPQAAKGQPGQVYHQKPIKLQMRKVIIKTNLEVSALIKHYRHIGDTKRVDEWFYIHGNGSGYVNDGKDFVRVTYPEKENDRRHMLGLPPLKPKATKKPHKQASH